MTAYAEAQSLWTSAKAGHAAHTAAVISLLDQKAACLQQELATLTTAHNNPSGLSTALAVSGAALVVGAGVLAGGFTPLLPGQVAVGDAAAVAAEAKEAKEAEDYALASPTASADQLPALVETLTDEQKAYTEQVWHVLKNVFTCADLPRMSFASLGLAPVDAMDLLGADIWRGFFGPTREVQDTDIIPFRLMGIIDFAVKRTLVKNEELVQLFAKNASKADEAKANLAKLRKLAKEKEEARGSGVRKSGLKQ